VVTAVDVQLPRADVEMYSTANAFELTYLVTHSGHTSNDNTNNNIVC